MVFATVVGAGAPELPFGGFKRSGFGRELGKYGADEFVNKSHRAAAQNPACVRNPTLHTLLAAFADDAGPLSSICISLRSLRSLDRKGLLVL